MDIHNRQIECIYTMHVPSKTRIVISDKPLTSIAKKQTSVLLPQQQNNHTAHNSIIKLDYISI